MLDTGIVILNNLEISKFGFSLIFIGLELFSDVLLNRLVISLSNFEKSIGQLSSLTFPINNPVLKLAKP